MRLKRIAHYDVTALIGEGGMGQVWQATDTQLNRQVALKILPDAFAADPDRLARFTREAQILASLNHPNIAAIHGIEEAEGTRALVLELVEGPTLADRIAQGAIPIEDALPIAKQIAEALEAAHEAGVIHRDLKPANIKVREDGTVKVLDFGLAKALDPLPEGDPSNSPTLTAAATQMGVIMGTAAYMSPEQARGKPVDKRADIWAFGVVVYEMLTGRHAFAGDDVSETLAAVLTRDLDLATLPRGMPSSVVRVIRRCLERDRRARLRDIGDARPDLVTRAGGEPENTQGPPAFANRTAQWLMAALVLSTVGLGALVWLGAPTADTRGPTHMSIALPAGHALVAGPEITNDGQRVAFVSTDGLAQPRVYTRRLDEGDLRVLEGTEGASFLFFSPEGRWIAFYARGGLFKVRVDGGTPIRLTDAQASNGGFWLDDDTIFFMRNWNGGVYRIDANATDEPEPVLTPDRTSYYAYVWPFVPLGGRYLLFSRWGETVDLMRLDLDTMLQTPLLAGHFRRGVYTASGHVVVGGEGGDLLALPADPAAQATEPELMLGQVDGGGGAGYTRIAVSQDGTLVYGALDPSKRSLAIVEPTGTTERLDSGAGAYDRVSIAPDGRRVAVVSDLKLFLYDLDRGSPIPFVPEFPFTDWPVWSADGARVIFASNHEGTWNVYSKSAFGTGAVDLILESRFDLYPMDVARDGTVVFMENHEDTGDDLWLLPPGGEPEPWRVTRSAERQATLSPDDRVMAFTTNEAEQLEVRVRPLDKSSDPISVSTGGGTSPVWSPSGDRLYFRQGHRMMVSEISRQPVLSASVPRVLFDGGWELSHLNTDWDTNFDILPDGKFLMVHNEPEAVPTRINVIFNWFQELKERVPVN